MAEITGLENENIIPWNVYPRPQLRRANYKILNGIWKLNGRDIVVPFPPQSKESGYMDKLGCEDKLVYELDFVTQHDIEDNGRCIMHFGAVDQIAEVVLNGHVVGTHMGGYLPFSFDVTEVLMAGNEINHLRVNVEDTLSEIFPYGKQSKKPGGMWYTPVSGIWQTLWLEYVPVNYVKSVKITPDLEGIDIKIDMNADMDISDENSMGRSGFFAKIFLEDGEYIESSFEKMEGRINLQGACSNKGNAVVPKLWTCENPHLYYMEIRAGYDVVQTYFGLRTVDIRRVGDVKKVCLNGVPVFMHGVLDQGYFHDGIFLPRESKEYERDILRMKELGFNMLRKHIKVEPELFYYYCDKHGMLVVQDMVNSGKYSFVRDTVLPTFGFGRKNDRKIPWGMKGLRSQNKLKMKGELARREIFEKHMKEILQKLYNHPSIVTYTIFNEGWGQFDSDRLYMTAKSIDDTRLYDSASGWFAQKKSDFDSKHIYFRTVKLKVGERPLLLSECGGYTYAVCGHLFSSHKSYGYGKCKNEKELTEKIISMYRKMVVPAISEGLCGCVYTQLSDVEEEINGLYTYDRSVCKVDKDKMLLMAHELKSIMENVV